MERWRVSHGEAGQRLDRAVAKHLATARNQVQGWIRDGLVRVDGKIRRASFQLDAEAEIECSPRLKETTGNVIPEAGEIPLLHVDEHLIVVDKPAGLAVHPGAGRPAGTLVNRLLHAYPELARVGGVDRPGIVHRLDIDTTGVLVVARTERAYQALSRDFAARRVTKTYVGIVFGSPSPAAGVVDLPLGRHPSRRKEMTVRPDGRESRTGYRVRAVGRGTAVVELDLETGRTHQIRVHLKALRNPLVGDTTYAGKRWRGAPRTVQRVLELFPRPALHALALEITHPETGVVMRFEAPLPADLEELWHAVSGEPFPG